MAPRFLLSSGSNARGQLSIGSFDDVHSFARTSFHGAPPGTLPDSTTRVAQVACGSNFTLLLLDRTGESGTRRELWASGDGRRGQLGPAYSREQPSTVFVPVDLHLSDHGLEAYSIRMVAAGWETSYIVLTHPGQDDVLVSIGANDFGDLGIGSSKSNPSEFGQLHRVDMKSLAKDGSDSRLIIHHLAAGTHHVVVHCTFTYADDAFGSAVIGWGTCRHGQLGPVPRPTLETIQSKPTLVQSLSTSPLLAIRAGFQHTAFLYESGVVEGLGSNRKSQLSGLGDLANVSALGCTWYGTYSVVKHLATCRIIATGDNAKGQLGSGFSAGQSAGSPSTVHFPFEADGHDLVKIACGSEHVLCIFSVCRPSASAKTEVWAWGWNEHGNLGVGHTTDVPEPTKIWPLEGNHDLTQQVSDVWAGCGTSWILVEDSPM